MPKQKSLPEGLSEESIIGVYEKELDRHSENLIAEIKAFLALPLSAEVKEANVEVFPDEYGDGHVGIGLYLTGKTTKHTPFADSVRDLPLVDIESYNENEIYVVDLVVDVIKQWFSESWFKAGGWDFPLEIVMAGHDGFGNGKLINLTKKC
jgi:hypothetical protein